jgi:thioesterase domain-containing protein
VAIDAEHRQLVTAGRTERAVPETLERYLHARIPLSAALGVRVVHAGPECVRLTAPFAPNINHAGSVFGGSAAAVATLAAWGLLHVRLASGGLQAQTVIQRNRMEYLEPIRADFESESRFDDVVSWGRFLTTLHRRGRARLMLTAQLSCLGRPAGQFEGAFVALGTSPATPRSL